MNETMKTMRLHKARLLQIGEEPIPDIKPGEVLLRVHSVGICASDVHYYNEGAIGDAVITEPLVLGHEAGGEVVKVAPDVTSLVPGDRVAVEPGKYCGRCSVCRSELYNLCPNVQFFGTPPTDGALREYIAWPADLCLKIPAEMSLAEAAMTEPMAVGIYGVDMAGIKSGASVAILGVGAIGLSVLQAARMAGAGTIWVADPIMGRTELAKQLGASQVFSCDPNEAVDRIWAETGRVGPNVVFECAGTNDAVKQSVRLSAFDGQCIVVGIPYPDEVSFTASVARRKNLTIKFVRRSRNSVERAIKWTAERRLDLKCYVTHHFPLERTTEALEVANAKSDGVIRAVIDV